MRRKLAFLTWVWAALFLSACGENGVYSGKLVLDGSLEVGSGQVERSAIVLLEGEVTIQSGGEVQGNIYQILGDLTIDGEVNGDVFQFGGQLSLGPQAKILGNLELSGGAQAGALHEVVQGEIRRPQGRTPLDPDQVQNLLRQRLSWALVETVLLSLLALLTAHYFPSPLARVGAAIQNYPVVSLAMGLLAGIVGLALIVQMAFTIILIPVSMLGLVLFGLAVGLGWIGCGLVTGGWLNRRMGRAWPPAVQAALGTLLFMFIINAIGMLPVPGDLLAFITALLGLGAVFLTRFGMRRFIPAPADPLEDDS